MSSSTRNNRELTDAVGTLIFGFVMFVPLVLFYGWAIKVMWNWFIPTTFSSAPSLTIGTAVGLSLVVSIFQMDVAKREEEEQHGKSLFEKTLTKVFTKVLATLFILGYGAIVHAIVF